MTCKMTSKIFILIPIAQDAVHLLTDFTQLNCQALSAETALTYFLYCLIQQSLWQSGLIINVCLVKLNSDSAHSFTEDISW